jgi:hypothetical protein
MPSPYFTTCVVLFAACTAPSFNEGDYGDGDEPTEMRGVVAAHNEVRAEPVPAPSTPLAHLAWSSTLAEVAQDYADRCRFEHSNNDLGENLYAAAIRKRRLISTREFARQGSSRRLPSFPMIRLPPLALASNCCNWLAVCGGSVTPHVGATEVSMPARNNARRTSTGTVLPSIS